MAVARPNCAGCRQRDHRIAELEAERAKARQLLAQDANAPSIVPIPFAVSEPPRIPRNLAAARDTAPTSGRCVSVTIRD